MIIRSMNVLYDWSGNRLGLCNFLLQCIAIKHVCKAALGVLLFIIGLWVLHITGFMFSSTSCSRVVECSRKPNITTYVIILRSGCYEIHQL